MARMQSALSAAIFLGLAASAARALRETGAERAWGGGTEKLSRSTLDAAAVAAALVGAPDEYEAEDLYGCSTEVADAVSRKNAWRKSLDCKCPYDWVVAGESPACDNLRGNRLFKKPAKGIAAPICHCESRTEVKRFVPIESMVPTMEPFKECPVEYGLKDCPLHQGKGLPDLAENLKKWCRVDFVPEGKRMPKELQGFLWMYKDPLDDLGMCTSLAEWDQKTLTATLAPWTHFVFQKKAGTRYTKSARKAAFRPIVGGRLIYYLKFTNTSYSHAQIWTNSNMQNAVIDFPLIRVPQTFDGLIKGPGIYHRPSYFGFLPYYTPLGKNILDYFAVQIMDGDLNIYEDRYKLMQEQECHWNENVNKDKTMTTIVRYPTVCPGMEKTDA